MTQQDERQLPEPYYQDGYVTLYHGDARELLPLFADDSMAAVVSDPPYGINKAGWDEVFPMWWFEDAARIAPRLGLMPGIWNICWCPQTVGRLGYRWMLSAHLTNGMTRGAIGFGNWIPYLIYSVEGEKLHRLDTDCRRFVVGTEHKPEHPSPKPLNVMRWFVDRTTERDGRPVMDPFAGSGTTLRAAKDLGISAVGIELDERYCSLIAERCAQEIFDLGEVA
jgi:site-specific DNA-methyltransferase (adenine-specific)